MLRLDYFLMRGGLLDIGDVFMGLNAYDHTTASKNQATDMNYKGDENNKMRTIKSFAPRANNGKQPMPDDFPVVVTWSSGATGTKVSNPHGWVIDDFDSIVSWEPDLEKLIEQQAEYDAQQKPITNPSISNFKIYHGVVSDDTIKSWGGAPSQENPIEELMLNTKESTMKKQGDEVVIIYNDLIGSGRKEAVGTYQMETDKEILILDENGIFEAVDKEWFVEYALTDEQEMELAKEKQIDSMQSSYSDLHRVFWLRSLLQGMQANGDL